MKTTPEAPAKTYHEWVAEGEKLFGPDKQQWRFECPVCKHVATPLDWQKAGAPEGAIAFSCIGRYTDSPYKAFGQNPKGKKKGPCDYTGGGLFRLNPVRVADMDGNIDALFAFAVPTEAKD